MLDKPPGNRTTVPRSLATSPHTSFRCAVQTKVSEHYGVTPPSQGKLTILEQKFPGRRGPRVYLTGTIHALRLPFSI